MSETKAVALVIVAFLAFALAMCAILSIEAVLKAKYAMENGYSQQTLPGTHGTYWVKDGRVMNEKSEAE